MKISRESVRGCGWRKVGGLYLRCEKMYRGCGRLPIPLETCPCCGSGYSPARGWTWTDPSLILESAPRCKLEKEGNCSVCAIELAMRGELGDKVGLIWVGTKHYPTSKHFTMEVANVGLSRRINTIPRDFVLGETWVLLGHRRAILKESLEIGKSPEWTPGIFGIFKPDQIEVVCDGTEDKDTLDGYEKRGLTPVKIERIQDTQQELNVRS